MNKRTQERCYCCKSTKDVRWLMPNQSKRIALCTECADQIASRDGAPALISIREVAA